MESKYELKIMIDMFPILGVLDFQKSYWLLEEILRILSGVGG